jgi:lipopolysaccharide biosynthesis regulator YciM
VDEGWNDFSENAAERAAAIAMDGKDYDAAKKYYNELLQNAIQPDNLRAAYTGLMKAAYESKDYNNCIIYTDTLSNMQQSKDALANIQLYKAKALMERGDADQALRIFNDLDNSGSSVITAQARYYVPAILLQQQKLKEAESKAAYALQSASGNEYWTVKTYMLMSDILTAEKDYFNAKATLQSVIKNTDDATLKAEAKDKLEQVKSLEKKTSKLSE